VSDLILRSEQASDVAAVREVVEAAFGGPEVSALLDELRTSIAWLDLSFVAELDGEIVGHVAFSRAWVDDPVELVQVLVLSPLSVRPDRAGRGIATALIAHAFDAIAERNEPLVFVEGDPAFYSRLGFVRGDMLGFRAPSVRIPPAAFQVRPLPGRPGFVSGALVYPDLWWRHDAVGLRPDAADLRPGV
jgi:putative acetyltransferase